MCQSPTMLDDGNLVACRYCWQCKARKVDDWIGRNIAESKTSTGSHVVTLTYGEDRSVGGIDHIRAAVLTYSDVQNFMKKLRNHGHPARYFVTGEYGSKKGRAHWHIVIYWLGEVPKIKALRKNILFEHWEHGLTFWDKMSPEAIRYACKYITKDTSDDARQGYGPMMSKKPPLGERYFTQLAQRYVDAGLAPRDFFYSFPDVRRVPPGTRAHNRSDAMRQAKPIRFLMQGKTAETFGRTFIDLWEKAYPGKVHPYSEALLSLDPSRVMLSWPQLDTVRFEPETGRYFKIDGDPNDPVKWHNRLYGKYTPKGFEFDGEEQTTQTQPAGNAAERAAEENDWYDHEEIFGGI